MQLTRQTIAQFGTAALATVAVSLALSTAALAGERTAPVVVELFTSQGCDTCPPADAYLGELKGRSDVVALAWHVDYWDYIGWKDPYAQRAFTNRQRDYSTVLAQRYVYTPQMVINGRYVGIGSERHEIERLIADAKKQHATDAANLPALKVVGEDVQIGAGPAGPAVVWAAVFDPQVKTAVERGENAGRELVEYNVVREWKKLGPYDGQPTKLKLTVDMAEYAKSGCAIVVQRQASGGPGQILAAYTIDPPMRGR
jgi:hypothetical protein